MLTRIEVTQADIDKGVAMDCDRCPIWLAVHRVVQKCISVTGGHVWYADNRKSVLPDSAQNFIRSYDGGRKCRPFAFDLDIPE